MTKYLTYLYKKQLSPFDLMVFLAVQLFVPWSTRGPSPVSVKVLGYYLKKPEADIANAMDNIGLEKINKDLYLCDKSMFNDNPFVRINAEDFDAIIQSGLRNTPNLTNSYCVITRSLDWRTSIGSMSLSYISRECKVTEQTMSSLLKTLNKIGVVVSKTEYDQNTQRSKIIYTTSEHADLIPNKTPSKKINNRSVSMSYIHYKKNPDKYTDEQVTDIYRQCIAYNAEMKKLAAKHNDNTYLTRCKDLTIFPQTC